MTIVEFLTARLDEDEATAREASGERLGALSREGKRVIADAGFLQEYTPARVLREVEAKRRIIRAHEKWCKDECETKYPNETFDAAHWWSIKSLAAVYADHPEYDEAWRV